MKTTPILFSTEMVQAILAGNKTQTRRIIKPQPKEGYIPKKITDHFGSELFEYRKSAVLVEEKILKCPYGQPVDILWVRESWFSTRFDFKEQLSYGNTKHIKYKADGDYDPYKNCVGRTWKPSIHMPKAACRLFLKIKSIRVERLQDISEADAVAEGIEKWPDGNYKSYYKYAGKFEQARGSYRTLWQKINGPDSWDANPYVWVIEFEKTDKPKDF